MRVRHRLDPPPESARVEDSSQGPCSIQIIALCVGIAPQSQNITKIKMQALSTEKCLNKFGYTSIHLYV